MYIRKHITPQVILSHENSIYDTLIVNIRQLDAVICTIYRNTDSPNNANNLKDCFTKLEILVTFEQHAKVILMKGFSLPNVE